jgi:hypothetical protein
MIRAVGATAGVTLALAAGAAAARRPAADQPSAIRAQAEARRENASWGTLYTYFAGESYGTRDGLAAVAVIKPAARSTRRTSTPRRST